jgi:fructosamine-3-kinase
VSLPPGATGSRRVSGGSINDAFHVQLADGRPAFVKTRGDARPGEFAAEAAALAWLAEPGAVRIPEVLEVDDGYLALQWVEPGALSAAGEEELGRGLARLHASGASAAPNPTLWIGPLEFDVAPAGSWPEFYAERLVRPLLDRGAVDRDPVDRLCDRMAEFTGPEEPLSRLHGDLWSGNVLADGDGRPWLIDPSAYAGHREIDLAMLRLFGGPSSRVLDAYQEVHPLAPGHEDRVTLHQLFPLVIHAVLFGGGYRRSAEDAARRYVG